MAERTLRIEVEQVGGSGTVEATISPSTGVSAGIFYGKIISITPSSGYAVSRVEGYIDREDYGEEGYWEVKYGNYVGLIGRIDIRYPYQRTDYVIKIRVVYYSTGPFTFTWDANGGTPAITTETGYYEDALNPPLVTRSGYRRYGWWSEREGGVPYNPSTMPLGGGTAYKHWLKEYTIIYDGNGGVPERASDTGVAGGEIALPNATWIGHTFYGWWTAPSGGTKVGDAGDSYTIIGDATLYAHWTGSGVPTGLLIYEDRGDVNNLIQDAVSSLLVVDL